MAAAALSFWHKSKSLRAVAPVLSGSNPCKLSVAKNFRPWHGTCDTKKPTMRSFGKKSVLIVDDDARMLRALDKVLTGEGCLVTSANWAGDAIEILTERKIPVDLVITDLRMPFVTGITAVYAIHKMLPDLPVIVLTAFGSPDVKAECLRQGAVAFLEKPLNTSELMDVIGKVFASRPAGSGPAGSDGSGKEEICDENIEIENNRLTAGFELKTAARSQEPAGAKRERRQI